MRRALVGPCASGWPQGSVCRAQVGLCASGRPQGSVCRAQVGLCARVASGRYVKCCLYTAGPLMGHAGAWCASSTRAATCAVHRRPIDETCRCMVCKQYTRCYLHNLVTRGIPSASMLVTYHNIAYMQVRLKVLCRAS